MKRLMVAAIAVAAAGAAAVAVFGQENVPGMPTVARAYVLNRSANEAIPVVVHPGVDLLPVSVVGTAEVRILGVPGVTAARQRWEYRQVVVGPDVDPTAALNEAGMDGWEAVAVLGAGADRAVLQKRPR